MYDQNKADIIAKFKSSTITILQMKSELFDLIFEANKNDFYKYQRFPLSKLKKGVFSPSLKFQSPSDFASHLDDIVKYVMSYENLSYKIFSFIRQKYNDSDTYTIKYFFPDDYWAYIDADGIGFNKGFCLRWSFKPLSLNESNLKHILYGLYNKMHFKLEKAEFY